MLRAMRSGNDGNRNHAARRDRLWLFLGVTLLACVSCSSDPSDSFPPEDGGNGGQSHAGSSGSAGTGARDGAAGHAGSTQNGAPGTGGSAANSGALGTAGDNDSGGDSGIGGTSGVGGTSAIAGGAGTGGSAVGGTSAMGGGAGMGGLATGGAGMGGTSATGGGAGTGGAQQGSFTLSTTSLSFVDTCQIDPKTLTITNTSSVALTWHATASLSTTEVTPNGSTLPPGQAVAVNVLPHPPLGIGQSSLISIDADVAPSQSVDVDASVMGSRSPTPLPPDIDFGNVAVGTLATASISTGGGVDWGSVTIMLLSDNSIGPDIRQDGIAPYNGSWRVIFQPKTTGAQQATLEFTNFNMDVCPPDTIKARGVGVSP